MGGSSPGQSSWDPYGPAPTHVPLSRFPLSVPAQEILLFSAAIPALLQLLQGSRAVLCFFPACSTHLPNFRRDCCFPSSNSKTNTIFPNHPVFQVRFVELLVPGPQTEQRALPTPSPPLPPLCGASHAWLRLKSSLRVLLMWIKPPLQTHRASVRVSWRQAASCTSFFRTEAFAPFGSSVSSVGTAMPFWNLLSIPLWLLITKLSFSGFACEAGSVTLRCLKEGDNAVVASAGHPRHGPACPSAAGSKKFSSERAALLDLFIFAHVCGLCCVPRRRSRCLKALYF